MGKTLSDATKKLDDTKIVHASNVNTLSDKTSFLSSKVNDELIPLRKVRDDLVAPVSDAVSDIVGTSQKALDPLRDMNIDATRIISENTLIAPEYLAIVKDFTQDISAIDQNLSSAISFDSSSIFTELDIKQDFYFEGIVHFEDAAGSFVNSITSAEIDSPIPLEFEEALKVSLDPNLSFGNLEQEIANISDELSTSQLGNFLSGDFQSWLSTEGSNLQDWAYEQTADTMEWFATREEGFRDWFASTGSDFQNFLGSIQVTDPDFANWLLIQRTSTQHWIASLSKEDLDNIAIMEKSARDYFAVRESGLSDWLANREESTRNWFAQMNFKARNFFANMDSNTRSYLSTRDEGFRTWMEEKGIWGSDAQRIGDEISTFSKNSGDNVSLVWKQSGEVLDDGTKLVIDHLVYVREQCGNLKAAFGDLGIKVRTISGDVFTGIFDILSSNPNVSEDIHKAAKSYLYITMFKYEVALSAAKYVAQCASNLIVEKPNFIQPKKPMLDENLKLDLVNAIGELEAALYNKLENQENQLTFGYDPNPDFQPNFFGLCGDLLVEKGGFGFNNIVNEHFQNMVKSNFGQDFGVSHEHCKIGDAIKFSGLTYFVTENEDIKRGILDSIGDNGKLNRSRYHKEIWSKYGEFPASFSKDMLMGFFFYLLKSKDIETGRKVYENIVNNGGTICPIIAPGSDRITPEGTLSQFGTCFATPTTLNNLRRVLNHIGAISSASHTVSFLIDEDQIEERAGIYDGLSIGHLSEGISDAIAIIQGDKGKNGDSNHDLDSYDFELHLNALSIFLYSELDLLTPGLAKAARNTNIKWHEKADELGHPVENLFYQFMDNYTNDGDQEIYAKIANKLIKKVDCWKNPFIVNDYGQVEPNSCWQYSIITDLPINKDKPEVEWSGALIARQNAFDISGDISTGVTNFYSHRKGWSFQREPKNFDVIIKPQFTSETSNPFGFDLLFLAYLLKGI